MQLSPALKTAFLLVGAFWLLDLLMIALMVMASQGVYVEAVRPIAALAYPLTGYDLVVVVTMFCLSASLPVLYLSDQ